MILLKSENILGIGLLYSGIPRRNIFGMVYPGYQRILGEAASGKPQKQCSQMSLWHPSILVDTAQNDFI